MPCCDVFPLYHDRGMMQIQHYVKPKMKTAVVLLTGMTPMIHSRYHDTPKKTKEQSDAYEDRTWMEKLHQSDGVVLLSGNAIKKSLDIAVQRLGEKTKGKGTYTKHFKSGVRTIELYYPTTVKTDQIDRLTIFCEVSKGSGTRVKRHFPQVPTGWQAVVEFMITDDMITRDVFERSLVEAGKLIGIGSFRFENGGRCGGFNIEIKSWEEV